ncbi:ExbD/TolR family protein [Ruegeria profundi]|uniref:Indolepyruvate ferredoxin oxidoreductase n=1 Tax=Ruegeria profundi TaxID=1685378 RepID=A0A0X3U025_9RHOB|nr:biopolymer transporter ExbD [Ruegeria profundi]KUJ81144.1 indolepyruvate ferredoxin oxidoreductase [Ruegeria profundi]
MNLTEPARPRRKPSLTPMIDVVFLLLVFFMLASRFGVEAMLPLPLASSGGASYNGPPRLVDILPDGVMLNGQPVANLPEALKPLTTQPTDLIILRGKDDATLQRVVTVTEQLRAAGFTSLVLVE